MSGSAEDNESLASALGRIPSGLFILTARHGDQEIGMLVSWVQQCSFEPPQVTIAVKKGRDVLDWLSDGSPFVLNVLPEGAKALIGHFGKGFESGQPAFEGVKVTRERGSVPVLLAAHAYLACRVVSRVEAGDHMLVIGRVLGGAVLNPGHPTVHVRKNGLKY
jgi:flavin reductase (DIM6/NTAB) family NADH-FMN oxidoreductase RutF